MAKLTRARNNVRGTYKYDSIGVPITIEGTIEPSGAMALTETVTDRTWKAYRDAELALYDHVHGAAQGHDAVRRAVTLHLSEHRAKTTAPPEL